MSSTFHVMAELETVVINPKTVAVFDPKGPLLMRLWVGNVLAKYHVFSASIMEDLKKAEVCAKALEAGGGEDSNLDGETFGAGRSSGRTPK